VAFGALAGAALGLVYRSLLSLVVLELFNELTLLTANLGVSVVFFDGSIDIEVFFFNSDAFGAVEFVEFSRGTVRFILKSYLIFNALFSAA
jgi:hypothetical protein